MSDAALLDHISCDIHGRVIRSADEFFGIFSLLRAAREVLDDADLDRFLSALPFPDPHHMMALSTKPIFAGRHPSQAALGEMLALSAALAKPAEPPPVERQVRFSSRRLEALTGLDLAELTRVMALSEAEFSTYVADRAQTAPTLEIMREAAE